MIRKPLTKEIILDPVAKFTIKEVMKKIGNSKSKYTADDVERIVNEYLDGLGPMSWSEGKKRIKW